jgi:hypothetical protein
MRRFLATFFAIETALCAASIAGQPSSWSDFQLFSSGKLDTCRETLSQILQFKIVDGRLQIDRKAWEHAAKEIENENPDAGKSGWEKAQADMAKQNPQAAAQMQAMLAQQIMSGTFGGHSPPLHVIFENLGKKLDNASSGSGSGGTGDNQTWDSNFMGQELRGGLNSSTHSEKMTLEELNIPNRSFEFSANGDVAFEISLSDRNGDLISARQWSNGRFSVVALLGKTTFADQRDSFAAFVKANRSVVSNEILPTLQQFGFDPILSPDGQDVRHAVLISLLSPEEIQAEGKQLISDLDNDNYDIRERATQSLSAEYELYHDAIQAAAQNQANSPDVQIRLQKIINQQLLQRKPIDTAKSLDLAHDAGYLVSLFDDAHSQTWPRIGEQLEKITGQKFGSDPTAWKEWMTKNQK